MTVDKKLCLLVIPDDYPTVLHGTYLEPRVRALAQRVEWHLERPADEAQLIDWIGDAEVIINLRTSVPFTRAVLERCPHLKLISIWAVGTDNVDLQAAQELGITVCNTPGYAAIGVAEHALALALDLSHRLTIGDRHVREGVWQSGRIGQLHGKTLGVIGAGSIGQRMMELGRALGMKVVAWTRHPSPDRAKELNVEFLELHELLKEADVVSLHLPLLDATRSLLGKQELALMKPTAIFVNTGRGAVVDEEALVNALQEGRLAGAGLDVFTTEPLPAGHPLTRLDNVVLSPHAAAMSPETSLAGLEMAVSNIERFLEGKSENAVVAGTRR